MKRWMLAVGLSIAVAGSFDVHAQSQGSIGQADVSTASEKISFANDALDEMSAALDQVTQLLEDSVDRVDEDQLQCIQMKQTSITALLDVSGKANERMQAALSDNLTERANIEFRKIAVALSKTRQFLSEAEVCASRGNVVAGTTDVEVLNTQGVTFADETDSPIVDVTVGVDPPSSSQFE